MKAFQHACRAVTADDPVAITRVAATWHCDTFGPSNMHRLLLSGDPEVSMPLTLRDLKVRRSERHENRLRDTSDMPLIFMNACGSSAVDPRQVGSFAGFFLQNENRGFIGAQTLIPDAFARAFAETCYDALVAREMAVGPAVLYARRKLAEREKNPLGILHMHYGPAELCVKALD